jgi:hypothetical protein
MFLRAAKARPMMNHITEASAEPFGAFLPEVYSEVMPA